MPGNTPSIERGVGRLPEIPFWVQDHAPLFAQRPPTADDLSFVELQFFDERSDNLREFLLAADDIQIYGIAARLGMPQENMTSVGHEAVGAERMAGP